MAAENLLPINSCGVAMQRVPPFRNTPPERADKVQKYSEPHRACFPWKNVQDQLKYVSGKL